MSQVSWPHKRAELREWLLDTTAGGNDPQFDIDELIHFLFDDTDLAAAPQNEVGRIIYPDETDAVSELTALLDEMTNRLGDVDTRVFLTSPDWARVTQSAKRLLKKIDCSEM